MTDTLGLLLVACVTAANIGDRDAAAGRLRRLRRLHRDITLVWAEGGYTGGLVGWCRDRLALTLEIVKRTDDMEGFVVLPRRWVAERTFAWLMNSRRLARDYETLPATSEAMIRWSMVTRMSRRLARPRPPARTECPRRLQEEPPALGQAPGFRPQPIDLRRRRPNAQLHRDLLDTKGPVTRGSLLFQHAQNPLIVRRQNRHRQPFPPGRHRRARHRRERRRRFLLRLGRVHGSGLGRGDCQGLDQFLPRDHPPVQLDLRGALHRTRAAASRSSGIPSTDATAHPSTIKRTQAVGMPPSTRARPCLMGLIGP
ncbi:transposase [Streptomyces sp. NBC_00829]|uniref:transposase n=1 Tax=Streptomyces sp. NBC_00829 TaxID=2903679 RepID=UPI003868F902